VGHRDRFWDAPGRFDSPVRGARERLESAEYDDTRTNRSATSDEHPLLRRSPRCFLAEHRGMGLEPFGKVPTSPIFSRFPRPVNSAPARWSVKPALADQCSPPTAALATDTLQPFQPVVSLSLARGHARKPVVPGTPCFRCGIILCPLSGVRGPWCWQYSARCARDENYDRLLLIGRLPSDCASPPVQNKPTASCEDSDDDTLSTQLVDCPTFSLRDCCKTNPRQAAKPLTTTWFLPEWRVARLSVSRVVAGSITKLRTNGCDA